MTLTYMGNDYSQSHIDAHTSEDVPLLHNTTTITPLHNTTHTNTTTITSRDVNYNTILTDYSLTRPSLPLLPNKEASRHITQTLLRNKYHAIYT